jgi:hypothetical protein
MFVQSNSASAEENAASSEELASQVKDIKRISFHIFTFTKTDLISYSEYKKSLFLLKKRIISTHQG